MRAPLLIFVVGLVGCETGGPPDRSARLVARYAMDEIASSVATDASGNNHDGACSTCPTVEPGKVGSAYHFDGGDQQVDVPPSDAFNSAVRGVSAAVWVKLDMAPPTIPGCALVKGAMWSLCVTPQLQPAFGSFNAGATITAGNWHHLALTYDGETKRIYVDGNEVGSMAGTLMNESGGLTIGAELIGALDEAHVYDGVLTDAEIADLMTP